MRHWHFYLTIIALICGTLFAWVFVAQAKHQGETVRTRNRSLVQAIRGLEVETQRLENDLAALRKHLDALEQKKGQGEEELNALASALQQVKLQAGLVELVGPGVMVTLDDNREGALRAQTSKPGQYRPEDFIIHDKNLLYVVNELKRAGAEAIAINGQRLVTGSDIRCVGTTILVNTTRLVPPYEIRALGDPEALVAAMEKGQEYPFLKSKGFPVTVIPKDALVIPAYRGSFVTAYLRPVEEDLTGSGGPAPPRR